MLDLLAITQKHERVKIIFVYLARLGSLFRVFLVQYSLNPEPSSLKADGNIRGPALKAGGEIQQLFPRRWHDSLSLVWASGFRV